MTSPEETSIEDSWELDSTLSRRLEGPEEARTLETLNAALSQPRARPPLPGLAELGPEFAQRYRLGRLLGRGAYGAVYAAQEHASGREVALKVLWGRLDEHERERFAREGELTASLRHPGIVRIHSAGCSRERPYLIYELVAGSRTLAGAWNGLDRRRREELIAQVAEAVGHAHERGVIHRDLKPANVLLDDNGRARVTDFGLARAEGLARLTATGAMVGTPAYMSPEQVLPRERPVGPPADVWALGVMLYRSLVGRPPFQAESMAELALKILCQRPRSPRAIDPRVSPAASALCLQALAPDPADRPPDGRAFAAALRAALDEPAPPPRNPRGLIFAGLGLVGVLVTALLLAPGAASDPSLAELVAAVEAGHRPLVELEEALENAEQLEAGPSRSEALLLLAERAGQPTERAAHARRALELAGPTQRTAARRALARALRALGQHSQAGALWLEAHREEGEPELLLEAAEDLLGAEPARALPLATRVREEEEAGAQAQRAAALELRALAALGPSAAQDAALTRWTREAPSPAVALGLAEAIARDGHDPSDLLQAAQQRWPRHDGLRGELAAALFLQRGELRPAARRLAETTTLTGPHQELRLALRELVEFTRAGAGQPRASRRPPALREAWRGPARAWLLAEVRRELALAQRAADRLVHRAPGTLDPDARRARARRLLAAAAELRGAPDGLEGWFQLARAHLEGSSPRGARALARAVAELPAAPRVLAELAGRKLDAGEPGRALQLLEQCPPARSGSPLERRLRRLRGAALLDAGRTAEALPWLERACGPRRLDPAVLRLLAAAQASLGRAEASRGLWERVELLERPAREEADALHADARRRRHGLAPADLARRLERALRVDPHHVLARFYRGRVLLQTERRREGLREALWACARDLRLLSQLSRDLLVVEHAYAGGLAAFSTAIAWGESDEDRRIQALLRAWRVEHGGERELAPPAVRALSAVLRDDPACVAAWLLRGFLQVRLGRWAEAERDLGVVAEADPDSPELAFYRALLQAARGAEPERVLAALQVADERSYVPWENLDWRTQVYPELRPYRDLPGFERLRREPQGSRRE